jgi:3-oxoacyl-[acyl-carrier protein] reductase
VKQPIPTLVLSNAFRTAVVGALKTLAGEVASEGVTVNVIATGRVATDRFYDIYTKRPGGVEQAHGEVPIGHAASPDEFAPLVVFLCGEPARYVTGTTIPIDGGLTSSLL